MPANVQTYIGREAAWHHLGTVTGKYSTWADILAHGGLDFDVFKSQLRDGRGELVPAWATFRWDQKDREARDHMKAQFLGVVGEDYKVINHKQGFEMIDALMQTTDGAHYETAGVLGSGEVVWGLADLGLRIHVGEDETVPYLLFATSHDGSVSYQFRGTHTRVVCQNTLSIALGEKARASFRIKHTKNAQGRIIDAHEALRAFDGETRGVEDKLRFLATRKMTREAFTTLMDKLFPVRKKEVQIAGGESQEVDVVQTRRENVLADILAIYEANDHDTFPEQRGTAYNLLNAITDYTDHVRSSRGGNGVGRAVSALFGSGDKLKTDAFSQLLNISQTLPIARAAQPGLVFDLAAAGLNVQAN